MDDAYKLLNKMAERDRVIDAIFDDPHPYTQADIEWSAQEFGNTVQRCKDIFIYAKFCVAVLVDGEPVYVVAQSPDGMLNTCMPAAFEGHQVSVTKALSRFARSEIGRRLLADSWIGSEWNDWNMIAYLPSWAGFFGYKPARIIYYPAHWCSWLLRSKNAFPFPHKKWRNLFFRPVFVALDYNGTGVR